MFLVDKYSPKSINESKFNNSVIERLQYMSTSESIPHILICGPPGCGKKTLIKLLLEMMYDNDVHSMDDTIYKVYGSGNKSIDVTVKQSNYHIVIEPNNNNFDRYLIQDIVKEYAKKMPLGIFKTRKIFRTVLINNIDNLSYYAQTSLRRTMEKHSTTCRFIMWCTCPTRVIDPLISRCVFLTLNSPSNSELFQYLLEITYMENIKISLEDYTYILDNVYGNIKEALWLLELFKLGFDKKNIYYHTIDLITRIIISHNIKQINIQIKSEDDKRLYIRDLIYNIMITNISGSKILRDIGNKLCENIDIPDECKYKIIYYIAYYEHNMVKCRRSIMHIEAPIIKIMNTLYEYEKKHPEYKQIFMKYLTEITDTDEPIKKKTTDNKIIKSKISIQ